MFLGGSRGLLNAVGFDYVLSFFILTVADCLLRSSPRGCPLGSSPFCTHATVTPTLPRLIFVQFGPKV